MAKSIVFLGSKPVGYQCLEHLINHRSALGVVIIGIRTQSRREFTGEHNLKRLAEEYGIPVIDTLDDLPQCDIIYSVQHHELLKQADIAKARQAAVNLHLAPLPEYRGCNQFSFAIMDKASQFGVTIHEMDTRIDHGAILFERRFALPQHCWVSQLYEQTVDVAFELFKDSLPDLLAQRYKKIEQASRLGERVSALHYRNEINALKLVDLNAPADEIERRIRATYMPGFEPPYCFIDGKKVFFNCQT